ncbi:MAG: mechanosensitive ion channel family protein [Nanoarchaeota archaeon]|nr:mechanosensitive ion channel family protein [Nanoarchaeota archaeon]
MYYLGTQPGKIFLAVLILVITFFIERFVRIFIKHNFDNSSAHMGVDTTTFVFFKHLISALIYLVGIGLAIYVIPTFRTLSISIFASAGVLAVVLGFAAQKAFSNVISGIFIAMFRPFRVGDLIKFGDKVGRVEDINLRHTIIRNFENKRYIVPNSVISEEVIENYHLGDPKVCRFVEFGISYDSDVDKAMKIMQQECEKHPECIDTRTEKEKEDGFPQVSVRVLGFSDSSQNLRAWAWAKNPMAAFRMGTDLNRIIKKRFDKEGIEIPYPYRTIVFKDKMNKTSRRSLRK